MQGMTFTGERLLRRPAMVEYEAISEPDKKGWMRAKRIEDGAVKVVHVSEWVLKA